MRISDWISDVCSSDRLFSAIFMGCAGYVTLANEHIRIDIVNSHLDKTTRHWIDIVGHVLFLIPLCVVMLSESCPYFLAAFLPGERSEERRVGDELFRTVRFWWAPLH